MSYCLLHLPYCIWWWTNSHTWPFDQTLTHDHLTKFSHMTIWPNSHTWPFDQTLTHDYFYSYNFYFYSPEGCSKCWCNQATQCYLYWDKLGPVIDSREPRGCDFLLGQVQTSGEGCPQKPGWYIHHCGDIQHKHHPEWLGPQISICSVCCCKDECWDWKLQWRNYYWMWVNILIIPVEERTVPTVDWEIFVC